MGDVACVDHECRFLRQGVDLGDRLLERAQRVRIGRLVEADMAIADLQEGKTAALGRLRFTHYSERVRHAAGNAPQHASAAPGHALQNFAPADAVSLIDFTHFANLLSAAVPHPSRLCGCQGKRFGKPTAYSRFGEKFVGKPRSGPWAAAMSRAIKS